MTKTKLNIKLLFLSMVILTAFTTSAQKRFYDTTTIKLFDDIEAIQSAYNSTGHISFNATYYYEDRDSIVVRDTALASYKIYGDKFRIVFDSTEFVQSDQYNCTMYHDNRTIVIQQPVSMPKEVMQINVMDTVFQQLEMSKMTSIDSSGFRKISLQLDANALYKSYVITFNKSTYQILYIQYALKKDLNILSEKEIKVFISFNNYQTGAFSDSVFLTDPLFIVKSSKEILPGPALPPDYEIINMLDQ
ncbi:MAG: hypothetical protein JWP81_5144 [Ferruginibacter sp.]|nr:hypothetical protein [Ferruginibacter sp.]